MGSHLGHSAILPLQRDRLFLLKWWHFPLLRLFQRLRHLLFPTFSFSCGHKNTVTKPNIQEHMYCFNWERNLFCRSLSWTTNSHKGDGRTCCRQSSGTMICAMSRKSGPTTEDSNAKCLLTYLNCYPAHERAANVHCTKLTIKDHITDYFPIITNLDSFRFSALPCRSTKCQQYPWTHLKGTQHLWKKTKPGKMLPNWPVFRELQLAGHCSDASGEHELITAWCTQICTTERKENIWTAETVCWKPKGNIKQERRRGL